MSGDTLQCGHPVKYGLHPNGRCSICDGNVMDVRNYLREFHGIRTSAFDPIDFLQAIVDDPDSSLPRLVFADWLDEQGDPRGELIRVEAEMNDLNNRWEELDDKCLCSSTKFPNPPTKMPCYRCQEQDSLEDRWNALDTTRTALRRQLGYDTPAEPEPEPCDACKGRGFLISVEGGACPVCDGDGERVTATNVRT